MVYYDIYIFLETYVYLYYCGIVGTHTLVYIT